MSGRASLNHIYRTIWNPALGAMVAVAEIASAGGQSGGARSRATLAGVLAREGAPDSQPPSALRDLALSIGLGFLTVLTFASGAAHAQTLPTGGVAVQGAAKFDTSQTNKLTVTTTNGVNAGHSAINWNSFSIGAGNTVNFVQPSAASLSINRVVTNTPSQLFGTLSSNGQLVLVNQSGIAVGAGAVVDTAGFTASAVGMSQADAVAGKLRFSNDSLPNSGNSGNSGATGVLTVQGNIIARGGDVVLIAPSVDLAKTAVVESQGGSVSLVAGQSVELTGRGLEGITLQMQAPTDQAINLGTLKGDAVGIFAGTLRHSGMIQAVQANLEGGKVVLKAVGDAYVEGAGHIVATGGVGGTGGKGGQVDVLGERVAIAGTSLIDVSGQTGGGSIRIGGDFQGKNAAVQNANKTYLGPDATLKADAIDSGNGGRVIVWADQQTQGYGNISAQGGAKGGDGGFVEVSGKHKLAFSATVNTLASKGKAGTLLLDPDNINVSIGGTTALTNVDQFADPGVTAILSPATINAASTNVVLQANDDITFNSPVSMINPGVGLTAQAGQFITLSSGASVTTKGGAVSFIAGDPGSLTSPSESTVYVFAPIDTTGGGAFPAGAPVSLVSNSSALSGPAIDLQASVNAGTSNMVLDGFDVAQSGSGFLTAGSLNVTAQQDIILNQAGNNFSGNVSLISNVLATGSSTFQFNNSAPSFTLVGAASKGNVLITAGGSFTSTGPIISSGGSVSLSAPSGIFLDGNVQAATTLNMTTSAGGGSIIQTAGVITVAGATTAVAGTGDIALGQTGNDFNSISLSGGQITLEDANAVNITSLAHGGTQEVFLRAGGALTLPVGNIITTAPVTLISGSGFATPGIISGSNVLLQSFDPMTIAHNINASGTLGLQTTGTSGAIGQTAGAITAVGNTTVLVSSAADVSLNQPGNDFGVFQYSGASLFLADANAITLANVASNGNVSITAPAGITLTDNLTATGSLDLNSSAGNGLISQSGGAIAAAGSTNVNAGTGDILFGQPTNDFNTVNLAGGHLTVVDANALAIGAFSHGANSNVYFQAGASLTIPAGPITTTAQISLITDGTLTTPGALSGSDVVLVGQSGLTIAHNVTASGSLQLAATFVGGNIVQVPGTTIIAAGATTTFTNTITAGDITLDQASNDFATFSANGGVVSVGDINTLTLGDITASSLNVSNIGDVSQAPGTAIVGSPNVSITNGPGNVSLTNSGNDIAAYSGTSAGAVNIVNGSSSTMNLFNITAGLFDLTSPGNIGSSSTIVTTSGGFSVQSTAGQINLNTDSATSVTSAAGIKIDAATDVTLSGVPLTAAPGFNIEISSASGLLFATGATANVSGGGRWLTYLPSTVGNVYGPFDPLNADFRQVNAPVGSTPLGSGNGSLFAAPTLLTSTLSGAVTKVFDGTLAIDLTGAVLDAPPAGLFGEVGGTLIGPGGALDDPNAGTGKNVSITNLPITLADGLGRPTFGYTVSASGAIGTVTPASVSTIGLSGTRAYDGTAVIDSSVLTTFSGLVGSDTLTLSGAGSVANKNVGVNKAVSLDTLALGDGTGLAINYTLVGGTHVATITPATISSFTGITANNKVYDGTTNAVFLSSGASAVGLFSGDVVGIGSAVANFTDKGAALGKTVNITGITLAGTDAANYVYSGAPVAALADIARASITAVSGVTAANKVYDGTTAASISTAGAVLTGLLSGDGLALAGGVGVFGDKNAGLGKAVLVSGLSLTGTDLANYTLASPLAFATADISKATIGGVTGITASNKVYDGNTTATLSTASAVLSGLIGGDTVSVLGATGNFSNKNAGVGKTVTVAGLSLGGTDGGNYTLGSATSTALADITKATITSATGIGANNKVYDATTAATLNTTSVTLGGAISGDAVGVTGIAQFTDKNAGTGKTVNVTGLNLAGADAANYIYSGPSTATAFADISKASLGALTGVTASNKEYDGNTSATLVGAASAPAGVLPGDTVTVVGVTGAFADRNAGVDKIVSITGGTLSGADAGNYTLAGSTTSGVATITARPLAKWTGLGGGLWSDPANWDALPDGNNVLAVLIPEGTGSVNFDAAVGKLSLPAFTSLRPVVISGGELSFGSNLSLANLSQSGGTVNGAGGLDVTDSFSQTGGSMVFSGAVTARQTAGNLVVGDLSAPSVSLRALAGSIGQTGALNTPALVTESATGTALTNSANNVGSFNATNSGAGGISFANNRPLNVVATRNLGGNIVIDNVGKVDLIGLVNAPNGSVSVTANSPLRVGPEGISAGGDVTLVATNLTSAGDILIDGPIVSGGGVTMLAANTLTQNSVIFGANGVRASAAGGFTYGPLAVSGRSPVVYSSGGVQVRAPLSGAEARAEGVLTQDSIVTFLDLLGRAQRRQLDEAISTNSDGTLNRKKDREGIVAEGDICRP